MVTRSLEERIQRLEDVNEVQRVMAKYCYLHLAKEHAKQVELFAKNTPGVTAEIANWGVWEGYEGARILYAENHAMGGEEGRIGAMSLHTLTTPIVEVAGDGKTAKGLWISPGVEAHRVDGKMTGFWVWGKYGVDFVKEEGQWKLWHTHVYAIFYCPYDKSFVDVEPTVAHLERLPERNRPTKPTTYHWEYSPKVKCELVPVPPEPYETWDEKSVA